MPASSDAVLNRGAFLRYDLAPMKKTVQELRWGKVSFGTRLGLSSRDLPEAENPKIKLHVIGAEAWDHWVTRAGTSSALAKALAKSQEKIHGKMRKKAAENAVKKTSSKNSKKSALIEDDAKAGQSWNLDAPKTVWVPYEGQGGIAVIGLHPETSSYCFHEALRQSLGKLLAEPKAWNIEVEVEGYSAREVLSALTILAEVSRWSPLRFGMRSKQTQSETPITISFLNSKVSPIEQQAWHDDALLQARAINRCRFLTELPGNVLRPATYRKLIEQLCRTLVQADGKLKGRLKAEFWGVPQLQKKGAGSMLAVLSADPKSQGGIAHLVYSPPKKMSQPLKKQITLVGKGLCFDTGGYDVKVGGSMVGMHRDMGGSAVALAVFAMCVEQKVDFEVHCYLAIAENLIGPEGYKAGDVVVAANGTSIEVVDTDAEGRMVLCDTLALASEAAVKNGCDLILDFATLTGSMVRAVGTKRSGFVTNQESRLLQTVWDAGHASGERVWPFPYAGDYLDRLKSEVADVKQCSTTPGVDHILAAAFLGKFVDASIPWVHVDLSADSNAGGLGLVGTDVTGFGVRLARELITRVTE